MELVATHVGPLTGVCEFCDADTALRVLFAASWGALDLATARYAVHARWRDGPVRIRASLCARVRVCGLSAVPGVCRVCEGLLLFAVFPMKRSFRHSDPCAPHRALCSINKSSASYTIVWWLPPK